MIKVNIAGFVLLFTAGLVPARTLEVGPGKALAKPSQAAAAAQDGDTVLIAAGLYSGDACAWTASNLTLRGTAKFAHLESNGVVAQSKAIWVITGSHTTVENIEFSGATVDPDHNAAGIRPEGSGLIVRNCFFHDNQNGILTGSTVTDILVEYSEFADNGYGDGYKHNIYVGNVTKFTLQFCYLHHAKVGHNVKSRALKSVIRYNRIMSEKDGTTSYEVDFPDGGEAYVIGNLIQHGPQSQNPIMLTFAEESANNPKQELYVINNTLVDERDASFIFAKAGTTQVKIQNNLMVGADKQPMLTGSGDTTGNLRTGNPGFVDAANFDYRLTSGSPAIDKGQDPGTANGEVLAPVSEYVRNAQGQPRPTVGKPDVGAFEFDGNAALTKPRRSGSIEIIPNGKSRAKIAYRMDNRWAYFSDHQAESAGIQDEPAHSFLWVDYLGKNRNAWR